LQFSERYTNDPEADVYDLDITKENFDMVMERIKMLDDFYAYQILIYDFEQFLTPEKRRKIISDAKEIFDDELTKDWE
jgi:hypothetical protein